MELAGGMLMGLVLMFSLLAFYPAGQPSWLDVFGKFFSVPFGSEQIAGVGSANITGASVPQKKVFALGSPAFTNGSTTPMRFTCDGSTALTASGKGISPPLSIFNVPEKTQSLALIMEDPDAPNGTWVHWVAFNIPPTTRQIPEGKEPPGRAGKNSWGEKGYGAPCPPRGKEHRYVFRLYALSRAQALPVGSTKAAVLADMKGFVLGQTELVARYKRIK